MKDILLASYPTLKQSDDKIGLVLGVLYKQLKRLQTNAFDSGVNMNTNSFRKTVKQLMHCPMNAVSLVNNVIPDFKKNELHENVTSSPEPLFVNVMDVKIARGEVDNECLAKVRFNSKKKVWIRMKRMEPKDDALDMHDILNISVPITDTGKYLKVDTVIQNGKFQPISDANFQSSSGMNVQTFIAPNHMPYDENTVFRMETVGPVSASPVCFLNNAARAMTKCPLIFPFLPVFSEDVSITCHMRHGFVYDIDYREEARTKSCIAMCMCIIDKNGYKQKRFFPQLSVKNMNLSQPRKLLLDESLHGATFILTTSISSTAHEISAQNKSIKQIGNDKLGINTDILHHDSHLKLDNKLYKLDLTDSIDPSRVTKYRGPRMILDGFENAKDGKCNRAGLMKAINSKRLFSKSRDIKDEDLQGESRVVIFTKDELMSGVPFREFFEKLRRVTIQTTTCNVCIASNGNDAVVIATDSVSEPPFAIKLKTSRGDEYFSNLRVHPRNEVTAYANAQLSKYDITSNELVFFDSLSSKHALPSLKPYTNDAVSDLATVDETQESLLGVHLNDALLTLQRDLDESEYGRYYVSKNSMSVYSDSKKATPHAFVSKIDIQIAFSQKKFFIKSLLGESDRFLDSERGRKLHGFTEESSAYEESDIVVDWIQNNYTILGCVLVPFSVYRINGKRYKLIPKIIAIVHCRIQQKEKLFTRPPEDVAHKISQILHINQYVLVSWHRKHTQLFWNNISSRLVKSMKFEKQTPNPSNLTLKGATLTLVGDHVIWNNERKTRAFLCTNTYVKGKICQQIYNLHNLRYCTFNDVPLRLESDDGSPWITIVTNSVCFRVVAFDTEKELNTHLEQLYTIHKSGDHKVFLHWWLDLFTLFALRVYDETVTLHIDSTLKQNKYFVSACVTANAILDDAVSDTHQSGKIARDDDMVRSIFRGRRLPQFSDETIQQMIQVALRDESQTRTSQKYVK